MKRILLVLTFVLTLTGLSAVAAQKSKAPVNRTKLLDRIEKACYPRVDEHYQQADRVCRCVSERLGRELNDSDLELITRSHEEDPAVEKELQKEKYNDLVLKDYDITEECLKLGKLRPNR